MPIACALLLAVWSGVVTSFLFYLMVRSRDVSALPPVTVNLTVNGVSQPIGDYQHSVAPYVNLDEEFVWDGLKESPSVDIAGVVGSSSKSNDMV